MFDIHEGHTEPVPRTPRTRARDSSAGLGPFHIYNSHLGKAKGRESGRRRPSPSRGFFLYLHYTPKPTTSYRWMS